MQDGALAATGHPGVSTISTVTGLTSGTVVGLLQMRSRTKLSIFLNLILLSRSDGARRNGGSPQGHEFT